MNEKKIVQIIANNGDYIVFEKVYSGWDGRRLSENRIKVVAWALLEDTHGSRWIEPLILGSRGLVLLTDATEWSIKSL